MLWRSALFSACVYETVLSVVVCCIVGCRFLFLVAATHCFHAVSGQLHPVIFLISYFATSIAVPMWVGITLCTVAISGLRILVYIFLSHLLLITFALFVVFSTTYFQFLSIYV